MKIVRILDEIDKKILDLLSSGLTQTQTAHKLWMNKKRVYQRARRLRIYFGCHSMEEMIQKYLSENTENSKSSISEE